MSLPNLPFLRTPTVLLSALFGGLLSMATAQQPFVARFETDANGVWLVYPSEPGWHYTVQYTTEMALDPDSEEIAFTDESDGYGYGTGGDLRFFVSPQLAPPAGGGPPPVKTPRNLSVTISVCNSPGDTRVEVSCQRPDNTLWQILAPTPLPRDFGLVNFRWETPSESWLMAITVMTVTSPLITATGGPASLDAADAAQWQLISDRWNDIIATLNRPNSPPDEPVPGLPGAEPKRRFFQVIKQPTDSNGNGIADWWELQYGFVPFTIPGETGYLGANNAGHAS